MKKKFCLILFLGAVFAVSAVFLYTKINTQNNFKKILSKACEHVVALAPGQAFDDVKKILGKSGEMVSKSIEGKEYDVYSYFSDGLRYNVAIDRDSKVVRGVEVFVSTYHAQGLGRPQIVRLGTDILAKKLGETPEIIEDTNVAGEDFPVGSTFKLTNQQGESFTLVLDADAYPGPRVALYNGLFYF